MIGKQTKRKMEICHQVKGQHTICHHIVKRQQKPVDGISL